MEHSTDAASDANGASTMQSLNPPSFVCRKQEQGRSIGRGDGFPGAQG